MVKKNKKRIRYGVGGTIGSVAGGLIGSFIAPGVGTTVGASIGGAIGGQVDASQQAKLDAERQIQQNRYLQNQQFLANNPTTNIDYTYQQPLRCGGRLKKEMGGNITQYNGPLHENGGIPIGNYAEVEGGETKGIGNTSDYIFSDTLLDENGKTFADNSKKIEKKYSLRKNDKFALEAKNNELNTLAAKNESLRLENQAKEEAKYQKSLNRLNKRYGGRLYESGGPYIPMQNAIGAKGDLQGLDLLSYGVDNTQGKTPTSYDWKNPKDVSTLGSMFTKDNFGAFQNFYKNKMGTDYPQTFENLQAKIQESTDPNNLNNGQLKDYYGNTSQDGNTVNTIPNLIDFFNNNPDVASIFNQNTQSNNQSNYLDNNKDKFTDGIHTADNGINYKVTSSPYNNLDANTMSDAKSIQDDGGDNTIVRAYTGGNGSNDQGYNMEQNNGINRGIFTPDLKVNNTTQPDLLDTLNTDNSNVNVGYKAPIGLAALSTVPGILSGISNRSIGNKIRYSKVVPFEANANLVDPRRNIQDTKLNYSGLNESIRQNAPSAGNYMSNRLASAAGQSRAMDRIYSQTDNTNAGILNQVGQRNAAEKARANQINVGLINQELQDKLGYQSKAAEDAIGGLGEGINLLQTDYARYNEAQMASPENYKFDYISVDGGKRKATKVVSDYGYTTAKDGNGKLWISENGKWIDFKKSKAYKKDKISEDALRKEIDSKSNNINQKNKQ